MAQADIRARPIALAVCLCTLPHIFNIPPWTAAVSAGLWVYAFFARGRGWPFPGGRILTVLAFFGFAGILASQGGGLGTDGAVALLSLMAALKILEIRTHRDRMLTLVLCYFLIVSGLFFSNSLGATLYMFFCVWCATAAIIHVNQPGMGARAPLRLSGVLMVQALPVMAAWFLLFPRIQGGLWSRFFTHAQKTGFSSEMSPGNIADLARNTAAAFRVEFEGEPPARRHWYWRGVALWDYDGTTWRIGDREASLGRRFSGKGRAAYTVSLEPNGERWLFALDMPSGVFARAVHRDDHTFYIRQPVTQRLIYNAVSYTQYNTGPLDADKAALALPRGLNPKTRELAQRLRAESKNTDQYVQKILAYFRENPFYYTLKPPLPGESAEYRQNRVDEFLFGSRRGFCGHYASAFAVAMRAAGVPCRVVAGYQGGARNPYGGHVTVRQSDAHAWCEVFTEEKGWTRVDPTAAVAPGRILMDASQILEAEAALDIFRMLRGTRMGQWMNTAGFGWDYINSRWNLWVMGYSQREQAGLWSRLGIDPGGIRAPAKAMGLALCAGAVVAFSVALFHARRPGTRTDAVGRAWEDFCGKLNRAGLTRRPGQGPVDYMETVSRARPDIAREVRGITSIYTRLRYGRGGSADSERSLALLVRRFNPPARRRVKQGAE
jgi:transglutaminase-like putative cysteine protease